MEPRTPRGDRRTHCCNLRFDFPGLVFTARHAHRRSLGTSKASCEVLGGTTPGVEPLAFLVTMFLVIKASKLPNDNGLCLGVSRSGGLLYTATGQFHGLGAVGRWRRERGRWGRATDRRQAKNEQLICRTFPLRMTTPLKHRWHFANYCQSFL